MPRLAGKIAVVTGSSSGIGKAIALTFAHEGARVVVAARRQRLCEQVVAHIRQRGGEALSIPTDVTNELQVDRLIAETVRQFGGLDILVNNAGIGGGGRIADATTKAFDEVMFTNLRGTFLCARAGFREMQKQSHPPTPGAISPARPEPAKTGSLPVGRAPSQHGGIIINMSSVAGVQAWAGTGIYSASKHGIMALTKAMADEGRSHKIKVCAICPGGVADELVDRSPEDIERSGAISPFDVAETAVYLCTLGPNATVQQVIIDRLMADW